MASIPLTVLHVVPSRPFGGLQKVAIELAIAQRERGVDAHIVSLYSDSRFNAYCQARGLAVTATREPRTNPLAWVDFAAVIRALKPTLVHLHCGLLWSNAVGLAFKSCPWIYHAHGPIESANVKARLGVRLLNRLCNGYIGISEWVSNSIKEILHGTSPPVVTIPNGLPVPPQAVARRAPGDGAGTRYGMATRLACDKGALEFLDVAAEIAKADDSAQFVLAGEGPLADTLREKAIALDIADRVDLPGFVSDMDRFWPSLDVALFTAPRDAFGLSLIEPMVAGVPVAAYRTGAGSDEVVEDGRTGLMAPWGDAPGLAQVCLRLAREPELAARLTKAAREAVENRFSIAAMTDGVNQVYDKVLGR